MLMTPETLFISFKKQKQKTQKAKLLPAVTELKRYLTFRFTNPLNTDIHVLQQ